jgi:hypothetical protein
MDVNGLPIEGFQSINLTAGLGAAPPLSAVLDEPGTDADKERFPETSELTEAEKEQIILDRKAEAFGREN